MKKGQVGNLIIILIVIGVIIYFLWPYLKVGIPYKPPEIEYKNDIITVKDYSVSSTEPYSGSSTTIKFYISNNGDKTAENVVVDFSDLHGMVLTSLKCEDKDGNLVSAEGHTCMLGDMESLDLREILAELRAPIVSVPSTEVITYKISYSYSGSRETSIPIIDGITTKRPPVKYRVSEATYGPIVVEFEPPVGSTSIENGKTVKEYWGVKDRNFTLIISFKHRGSSSVGIVKEPIEIQKDKIEITCPTLQSIEGEKCDKGCEIIPDPNKIKITNKESGKIVCKLRNRNDFVGWIASTVSVSFSYRYEFYRTQTFDVQIIK